MNIELLRNIGRMLIEGVPSVEDRGGVAPLAPLERGAGGDKTYPIDRKAEEIILKGLEDSGEPLSIISEEAGLMEFRGGGPKVLIDPIDGSRNAVSGIPFYCASIAVAEGDKVGDISVSYVINLINGEEFWAEKGKGAYRNGGRIQTQTDDVFYLLAYEAQNPWKDVTRILPLFSKARRSRCFGATALDLAYLSMGAVSVFANPSLSRPFDFAGGWLLVKEAGGVFTDIDGRGIEGASLGLSRAASLLASGNDRLHAEALKLLRKS